VDVRIQIFLISALAGGEWSASRPGRFTSEAGAPGTHWIGSWVDPRAGLNEEKILDPTGARTQIVLSSEPTALSRLSIRFEVSGLNQLIIFTGVLN
jgi:hypothetical protein